MKSILSELVIAFVLVCFLIQVGCVTSILIRAAMGL